MTVQPTSRRRDQLTNRPDDDKTTDQQTYRRAYKEVSLPKSKSIESCYWDESMDHENWEERRRR